jgi:ribulose-phosphate 3-epimerase
VHPGFGGQTFMHEVMPKLRTIAQANAARGHGAIIEVDGGIDVETIAVVADAGASCFVAGHAVFGQDDPAAAVSELRRAAEATVGARP